VGVGVAYVGGVADVGDVVTSGIGPSQHRGLVGDGACDPCEEAAELWLRAIAAEGTMAGCDPALDIRALRLSRGPSCPCLGRRSSRRSRCWLVQPGMAPDQDQAGGHQEQGRPAIEARLGRTGSRVIPRPRGQQDHDGRQTQSDAMSRQGASPACVPTMGSKVRLGGSAIALPHTVVDLSATRGRL
jgi:hypothetical protein